MNPDQEPYNRMTFAQYLLWMGEKFSPAAESMQMEAEYKSRSMAGLVPVTRAVKNQEDNVPRGADPMEVDALYGPDDYDDLEPGCECVALHESGFWGPCYYCQKQGHQIRACP